MVEPFVEVPTFKKCWKNVGMLEYEKVAKTSKRALQATFKTFPTIQLFNLKVARILEFANIFGLNVGMLDPSGIQHKKKECRRWQHPFNIQHL